MVKRPVPISLRLRTATESNRYARDLLARLKHEELLQRRVRWQATKALISIHEMTSLMSPSDRDRWRAECERAQSFLKK